MSGNQQPYQAQVNFYHEATGTRNVGDVFQVSDSRALQQLEQMGYIKKMDAQAHAEMAKAEQEKQAREAEYGKAQQAVNEEAGIAAHNQNVESQKLTQEMAQARQQAAQQNAANHTQAQSQQNTQNMTTTDKAMVQDQSQAFQPSATTNAATQAKVNEAKAARAGNRLNENK